MNENRGRKSYKLKIRDLKNHQSFECPLKEIAYDKYDTTHSLINLDAFIVSKTDANNKEELLSYLKKTYAEDIIKLSEDFKKNKKTIKLLKETLDKINDLNDNYEFYLAYRYNHVERAIDVIYKNNDIMLAMINEFYNNNRYNGYDNESTKDDIKTTDFFRSYFEYISRELITNSNLTSYILSYESENGEPFYRNIFSYVVTYPYSHDKSSDHYANMEARERMFDSLSHYRKLRDFQLKIDDYNEFTKEGILDQFRESILSDYMSSHLLLDKEYKDRFDHINYSDGKPDMDELYSLYDLDDLEKLDYDVKKR